ncbi:MAG: HAMP domain-containing histidine kinase [Oscillospiraceae bacterium]|nr:HAMP domain-containing histidine kinase [Oscillospiraceae bacterium]
MTSRKTILRKDTAFLTECRVFSCRFYVASYVEIVSDADQTLSILEENNGNYPKFDNGSNGGLLNNNGIKPKQGMSPEAQFETRFFAVHLNKDGETISANTGSIAAVATDEAIEFAEEIYKSGKRQGFLGVYRYSVSQTNSGSMVLFLDCSRSLSLFYRFSEVCLTISAIGIFGVFIIVLLLSKRAIKPIADSYAKQKHFITDAGHELKTPLTVINASTDVLEMTQGENEWTASIRNQVVRLTELTNSLVSLARMDEHDNKLMMTDFSLSDAVSESLVPFSLLAAQQEKSFVTNIQNNISFEGNEESLRKLVGILADNAIKYSSEKGDVSVTLRSVSKGPMLQVRNAVEEIEKGSHDELFERFYRGDASRSSEIGGYGIGLSIAKAIVNAHKGKIMARSEDGKSLLISVLL